MLESSGFRKYSTLLVIQLFSRRLCLCHCLCIRLCLCICVPNSFLNSYYHKLSENVWVWGCGASRSEIWSDVTMAGRTNKRTTKQGKIGLLSQWTMEGWDEKKCCLCALDGGPRKWDHPRFRECNRRRRLRDGAGVEIGCWHDPALPPTFKWRCRAAHVTKLQPFQERWS